MISRFLKISSLGLILVASPLRAEEATYTVQLTPSALLPEFCATFSGDSGTLPIVVDAFKDSQPDRQVAELKKGGDRYPVYLSQPIADTVREGIFSFLSRCGSTMGSASQAGDRFADDAVIVLSGEVVDFRVNWQKNLITAKGEGQLWVKLRLTGPNDNEYTFDFKVKSEAKGIRKKGISQIESELSDAYRQFLIQLSQYSEFQQALTRLSGKMM